MVTKTEKIETIAKVLEAKDRELLEFLATQKLYDIAKSTGSWEIARDCLVIETKSKEKAYSKSLAYEKGKKALGRLRERN